MKYVKVLQPLLFTKNMEAESVGSVIEVPENLTADAVALVKSGYMAEATEADFKAYEKRAAKTKGILNAPENKAEGDAPENKGGGSPAPRSGGRR